MLKRTLILLLGLSIAAPALAGGYGGHHYGYGGHFGYRHHGGGDGDVLLAGLVLGGLLGYFISEDRHYQRPYTGYSYRHDPYYYDEYEYYSYEPRVYRRQVRVTPPTRVVIREATVQTDSEFAGQNCQMTREYTTTIEIDGEKHEAYGTRCLTSDGSWVLGRPKLVPEFN